MKKFKLIFSIKLILILIVVILSTVPLILMRTVVNRTVEDNILKNTTILTQGILNQSQKYMNLQLKELEEDISNILLDKILLEIINKEGLSENSRLRIQHFKDKSRISSLAIINLDRNEDSLLLSTGSNRFRYLDDESKDRFLSSQQAEILRENHSKVLWLGSAPKGINDAIPSLWTYRFFKTNSSSFIIAGSLDKDEIVRFLAEIGLSSRSDALLLSSDNSIYPPGHEFFSYSFASEALSRSIDERYNIIYDTRETAEGTEQLMIQVYSDPVYFYNLIIITPQISLLRGYKTIDRTTSLTLLILAISSITFGLLFIYIINKRIKTYISAVNDITNGIYKIKLRHSGFLIKEDMTITNALQTMAGEIEKNRNALKYTNENLEFNIKERTEELDKSLNELHMTRQSLIHSEKMASMGRQGAKLAHEMNNPLSVAITASSHLTSTVKDINKKFNEGKLAKSDFITLTKTAEEVSVIIQRNLQHASKLTNRFKSFASDQSREEKRTIKIEHYIREIINSYSYKLKEPDYIIELHCDENLEIFTDSSIIYQTITNLINNTILHGFEGRNRGKITIDVKKSDDHLWIIYKDDGKGISEDIISQLYKPFFTTKADDGGTGLGLNIIKDLIETELDGSIECYSTPGEGAQFSISFPLRREDQ
ncbi:MAG: HAMP domain-containing histidine kinase [Spirochaetaceae bacterium]|nr:HAMP domain-containing histidine kinase [Spirochaetaceae bacterium]